jgi:hypothetical protein
LGAKHAPRIVDFRVDETLPVESREPGVGARFGGRGRRVAIEHQVARGTVRRPMRGLALDVAVPHRFASTSIESRRVCATAVANDHAGTQEW